MTDQRVNQLEKKILHLGMYIKELEDALEAIARWNKEDEKDPSAVLIHWRGCVAIASLALAKKAVDQYRETQSEERRFYG